MEVKIKGSEKFEPIELTITIESEKELCDLWHRFNLTKMDMSDKLCFENEYREDYEKFLKHKLSNARGVWEKLNELVEIKNLKK